MNYLSGVWLVSGRCPTIDQVWIWSWYLLTSHMQIMACQRAKQLKKGERIAVRDRRKCTPEPKTDTPMAIPFLEQAAP